MSNKTWRRRWLSPLARLLRGDISPRRGAAGRNRVLLNLEELETRLTPSVTLTSLNPNPIIAGSPDTTVTLNGAGFDNNSAVQLNGGGGVAYTLVSANQIAVVLPAADLVTAGKDTFYIVPADPNVGVEFSGPQTLTISPASQVQFTTGTETINAAAGTFSIPVTLSGNPGATISTFASNLNSPNGVAFDAAGNLYVTNYKNNNAGAGTVSKVTPAGVVTTFASGFSNPDRLAFDAAGNLYVSNGSANTVSEVTPGGVVSTFASGFNTPNGLAFDAAGNLYVSNAFGNTVSKVTPAGVVSTFATGLNFPGSLAFDAAGNLYVANDAGDANTVVKVTPDGVVSPYASGFSTPAGMAFDAAGNLFVANFNANTVTEVTPGGIIRPFAYGVRLPEGLAFDAAGNLDVVSAEDNTISKVNTVVTVSLTVGGTAALGTDYSGVTSGTLTFPAGQTTENITGKLIDKGAPGSSKTITFTLGAPSSNAGLGSPAVNTLTIEGVLPKATTTVAVLKSDGSLWQDGPGVGLQLLSPAGTILSISSVTDGAGNVDVYAVTSDHQLWEHTPTSWLYLSAGSFLQLSAATNLAGNAVVFAVLTDNSLWENSSLFPGDHWGLLSPSGTILSVSAVTDSAGRDDVYAVTSDSHLWEHAPTGWTYLSGNSYQQISAGLNGAGQAVVYGVGTDHSLTEYNAAFTGGSTVLSGAGTILSVSAGAADDVFAITSDNHLWEHTPTSWLIRSTGSFASLSGANKKAGQGDVFAVLTDTSMWEYDPAFPGLWQDLVPSGASAASAARTR